MTMKKDIKEFTNPSVDFLGDTYNLDIMPAMNCFGSKSAFIYLKSHSTDEHGYRHLRPVCVTLEEVKYQVAELRGELDEILERAEQHFAS